MTARRAILCLALLPILALVGCVSGRTNEIPIGAGDYERAFDAAREIVIDLRFDPDRIDARSGVITSAPKRTAGILTPWDREQSSFSQVLGETITMTRRVVRIGFHPTDEQRRLPSSPGRQSGGGPSLTDLRLADEPLVMRVRVDIEEAHRAGRRISPASVRRPAFAIDPSLGARGMAGWYSVPVGRDEALEREIAERVRRRVERTGGASEHTPR